MIIKMKRGFAQGTKRADVVVPDQLRVRHSTGVEWVDDCIGNKQGLVPSTVVMLTGTPGAGKSTMLRILANSLAKKGHVVVLNSGEESLYQVALGLERLNAKEDFYLDETLETPNLIVFLEALQKLNPDKQVILCLDSIQTQDDGKYSNGTNGKSAERATLQLTEWAKDTFGIVIFVGQVNKAGVFSGTNTMKHAVDVHAHMYIDDSKRSETYGSLLFECSKNRIGPAGKTYILRHVSDGIEECGYYKATE